MKPKPKQVFVVMRVSFIAEYRGRSAHASNLVLSDGGIDAIMQTLHAMAKIGVTMAMPVTVTCERPEGGG